MRRLVWLVVLLTLACVWQAEAVTYYVTKTGSDSNTCTQAQTQGTAKLTIAAGTTCLSSADTLLIGAGTYVENFSLTIPSGTGSSARTTISRIGTDTVVIKPTADRNIIQIDDDNWIDFDSLIVDGADLPNNTCRNGAQIGNSGAATNIRLLNMTFRNMAVGNGIVIGNLGDTITVSGNTVQDLPGTGANGCQSDNVGGVHGFYIRGQNMTITNNVVQRVTGQGIQVYNSGGLAIANAIIERNHIKDWGTGADGGRVCIVIGPSNTDAIVRNNICDTGTFGEVGINSAGTNTRIYNNTVYNTPGASIRKYGTPSDFSTAEKALIKNNIFYPYRLLSGHVAITGNYSANPLFDDATAGSFTLQTASGAIDTAATIALVTNDRAGTSRPVGPAYDYGAYERTIATPPNIYYVSLAGSDSNTCTQAKTLSTAKRTPAAGLACATVAGDVVRLRDDDVFRVSAQITTSRSDVTITRTNTGTRKPEITHAQLVTGWTATGTPNVWGAVMSNYPGRAFWMARYDLDGPDNTITNPVAYTKNAWHGTRTALAKSGTCTPALLNSNYEHCWRNSSPHMLMYWATGDPDTMQNPGIEAIALASEIGTMIECFHSGITIDGVILGPADERHIQLRQGCNNFTARNIETWYSRHHDPEGWATGFGGNLGNVSITQEPDDGNIQTGFLLEDSKVMFNGRDGYHAAQWPTTGNTGVRDGVTIQRSQFHGSYNHAPINICHSAGGTTRNVLVDQVTISDACAGVISWNQCAIATTNVTMRRMYLFDMTLVGDPNIPTVGGVDQCDSNNHWFLVNGAAGSAASPNVLENIIVTTGNHGVSVNHGAANVRINNSTIVNTNQIGVRANTTGAANLETNRSIVAFNGTSAATSNANAQFGCAASPCTSLTWKGNDNVIRKDGGGNQIAWADGAARTLAQFAAIDSHDGNSQDADPLISIPAVLYAPQPGDYAPQAGSPAISDTTVTPYIGAGRESGALELMAVNSCTTLTSVRLSCTFSAIHTPIVANCALLTPSVNGGTRTASNCDVTSGTTVSFDVDGTPMVSTDTILMAFSLGGIQSGPAVGDPNSIFIRAPLLAQTGVAVTNTLSGGGGGSGTFEQVSYRCRKVEYGGETFGQQTTLASENTPCNVVTSNNVQIRVKLKCNTANCAATAFRPYISSNGGSYVPLLDTLGGQKGRYGFDSQVTDLAPVTTEQLTASGTFVSAGVYYKNGSESTFPGITLTAGQSTDYIFVVRLSDGAVPGDTLDFRLYTDAGVALTTYTQTPRIVPVGAYASR